MVAGRPKKYDDAVVVTIKTERRYQELARALGISDSDVYSQGVEHIANLRSQDLGEQQITTLIQLRRTRIQTEQEAIMMLERLMLDAKVREQSQKKRKIETRIDDRGRAYLVVEAP